MVEALLALAAFLALFYTRGLGIVVLHVMFPQPYRFSPCFLTLILATRAGKKLPNL
jgi:hypothetical protein